MCSRLQITLGCGEGGIRTPGTREGTLDFESSPFNHSGTSPKKICGEGGIRTLDTLLAYTHFPGALLKPLGHLSGFNFNLLKNRLFAAKIPFFN